MARPQINFEQMPARFPKGTLRQIDRVLDEGETRSNLIREAVEREIKRRKEEGP